MSAGKKGKAGSLTRKAFNAQVGSRKKIVRWQVYNKDTGQTIRQARREGLFNELEHPSRKYSPEQKLLVEILRRAILDLNVEGLEHNPKYLFTGEETQATRNSAREYLMSDRIDEFSFVWICQHLELDHEALRECLIKRGVLDLDGWAH